MTSNYRAVYFDLGGTLFSNRAIPKLSMPLLMKAGERLAEGAEPRLIGESFLRASQEANVRFRDRSFYLHRDLFEDIYRTWAELLGGEVSPGFIDWIYTEQRRIMTDVIEPRKDCLDTLQRLRESDLGLGIVSNIDDDHLEPMIHRMKISPLMDHWTSSEEARSCKPHSRIFEIALDKGGVAPEEVLYVGDSRTHDVAGAHAAGLRVALIVEDNGGSILDSNDTSIQPDFVISALSEIPGIVAAD